MVEWIAGARLLPARRPPRLELRAAVFCSQQVGSTPTMTTASMMNCASCNSHHVALPARLLSGRVFRTRPAGSAAHSSQYGRHDDVVIKEVAEKALSITAHICR